MADKKTVLVTGAGGALAKRVIARLHPRYQVVAVDFRRWVAAAERTGAFDTLAAGLAAGLRPLVTRALPTEPRAVIEDFAIVLAWRSRKRQVPRPSVVSTSLNKRTVDSRAVVTWLSGAVLREGLP